MAYGKRKYRYKRRRYKRKGKVYKKGIPRRALTGKVDTKLEKMVVRLAKKETKKLLVPLVYRQFFSWGDGDASGPVSFDYSEKGTPVPLEGIKFEIQTIPLRTNYPTGATAPASGFRATNTIRVYGITVGLRVEFENFDQADNAGYEHNVLHWAIVGCKSKLNPYLASRNIPAPVDENVAVLPNDQRIIVLQDHRILARDLLPLTPWGYSERLDNVQVPVGSSSEPLAVNPYTAQGKYSYKKTFHRGKVSSRFKSLDSTPNVKRFTKYIKLKKPMLIHYVTRETPGDFVLSPMKIFLVLRSEIPLNPANNVGDNYLPTCCGFYKMHYYDS